LDGVKRRLMKTLGGLGLSTHDVTNQPPALCAYNVSTPAPCSDKHWTSSRPQTRDASCSGVSCAIRTTANFALADCANGRRSFCRHHCSCVSRLGRRRRLLRCPLERRLGRAFGTLPAGTGVASIVRRAAPQR